MKASRRDDLTTKHKELIKCVALASEGLFLPPSLMRAGEESVRPVLLMSVGNMRDRGEGNKMKIIIMNEGFSYPRRSS
jgi:hypothetical protein